MTEPKRVLAVLNDLFFTVKLSDAAKRAGLALEFIKDPNDVLEKAKTRPSLIIFDLDYLKQINSKHGHIVGGQSLQAVGRLCREYLSANYIMAVSGGD